ncbi:hypothetical protein V493_01166 [Pseudogymnoascus sp. VKM F-4281 (FW-2241)]|nr:hypothetical protein V493_01166 [Pseudogymnoascus sp. VKM F-4281 (FW-2241)]
MSSSVDFRAGSTASRAGGGRGGRGGGRGRGGCGGSKGHYKPKDNFTTSTTQAIEAKKTATADIQHITSNYPVRNQIIWRKNRETDLSRHISCACGAGPFESGCISFSAGYGPGDKVPFGGACANCFWGGQGGRCSLRVGGARTRVRSGSLYQDKARTNTHLGSGFDLNTTDGVRDALAEIKGIERALNNRGRALESGANLENVSSEEDEDSDSSEASWGGIEE